MIIKVNQNTYPPPHYHVNITSAIDNYPRNRYSGHTESAMKW